MFWGAFCYNGVMKIIKTEQKMKAINYQNILKDSIAEAKEKVSLNNSGSFIFMRDNCSIHKANSTMEYLNSLEEVEIMDFPARSPDINPIENLWGILARQVYSGGKQYLTLHDLEKSIYKCWESIEIDILRDLILSMPERIGLIFLNQGNSINY